LTEKPAMPVEMWLPLLVMVIGFYCFFAVSLMQRLRNEIIWRERRAGWVRELLNKQ
jgi:heme exporter protein C